MIQKIIFCLFFFYALVGCNSPKSTKPEEQSFPAKNNNLLIEKVSSIKKKIGENDLVNINDSIRFYLYNVFYDTRMIADSINGDHFFCSFDLVPVFLELSDSSSLFQYELIKFDEIDSSKIKKAQIFLVQVRYDFLQNKNAFDKSKIKILAIPYELDRVSKFDANETMSFIKLNGIKPNKWYLKILETRLK